MSGSLKSPVSAVARLLDGEEVLKLPTAILLPKVATMKEGSHLIGDVVLGRFLGSGVQARVFELVHRDGRPTGKVIKIAHMDLGHKALNAVWISMEREWELGLRLRAALQQPDGSVPGFMRVYSAIVSQQGAKRAHFAGMILEKLNGWEVYKRIEDPAFHNIIYVREMLRAVFFALDRAQREMGFFHADMGMRNVMETYSEDSLFEGGIKQGDIAGEDGATGVPRPGWCCNADGSRMPLGSRLHFRIIDYGSSCFSDNLAEATGGFRARENYDRLASMFQGRHVMLRSATKNVMLEMETVGMVSSPDGELTGKQPGLRRLLCCGRSPTVEGASAEIQMDTGGSSISGSESGDCLNRFCTLSTGEGDKEKEREEAGSEAGTESGPPSQLPRAKSHSLPSLPVQKGNPIEQMYRQFWRRKGDVFHILLNLAIVLDDRVWPAADKEPVLLFVSLVHHCTGVKMKASFASESVPASRLGRLMTLGLKPDGKPRSEDDYGTTAHWYGLFRRNHILFKSHFYPFNSGLTAGEALVSPFFGQGPDAAEAVQHGLPLSAVFPRRE